MKKAVIATGGKQYIVSEGETLEVELLATDKDVTFEPLLVINGEDVKVGTPNVAGAKVTATVDEADVKTDKVTSIRYKAKKRVHKTRGHRQRKTVITIKKIS
ncbi:MAG: large subunit ribosomal protein [Patescibacteria group bacterium]|nr:large subunit ribosomal protein [Patescibacteria group bacterium]MDQ5953558.1 large subunit ribosomal protein [Patescibacteria group bacterium]